ncbi:hypothetical protein AVL56_07375 [Alteromonas stellipolaris]|nr:hypothetical protein AVL56_07375 [Alteromonas stellipolaris]
MPLTYIIKIDESFCMPLFLNEEKSVLFLHIPKTGGTTIENWLSSTKKFKIQLFYGRPLEDTTVTPQHFGYETVSKLIGDFEESELFKFAIVRDPYERLVSEFFYRIKLKHLDLGRYPERLFSCWVVSVLKKAKRNPHVLDNHIRPQTYFTSSDVSIYKFEDGFERILDGVSENIGVTAPATIDSHKVGTKKEVEWTDSAIAMVKEHYAADFIEFSYNNEKNSRKISNSLIEKLYFSYYELRKFSKDYYWKHKRNQKNRAN